MKSRLYNTAVFTSLVLFFVVMGLWVWSGFHAAHFYLEDTSGDDAVYAANRNGRVGVAWIPSKPFASYRLHPESFRLANTDRFSITPLTWWPRFRWDSRLRTVVVPHWLLAILTLILPVVWLIRRRRGNRDPEAVPCVRCGYDLRGSPDGACSECGAG